MSTSEESDRSPSVPSSSSESESEEGDEARESGREAEDGAAPPAARSMQVVSAAPRDSSGDESSSSSSSSSESEEDAKETADGEAPSRGKSYLQSIRARKPKQKVYVKPKDEGAESKQTEDDTTDRAQHAGVGPEASEVDSSPTTNTLQRGNISVRPTDRDYSSAGSGESSEESDEEDGAPVHRDPSQSSLMPLEMEEGERRRGGESTALSRFKSYAGSFRVKLSQRDRRTIQELESDESDNPDDLTGVFEVMSYENQPDILKKDSSFRRRANKAISSAVADVMPKPKKEKKEEGEGRLSKLCNCFKKKEREGEKVEKEPTEKKKKPAATQLSPQLEKASSQGVNMMKKVFFPALPHLLQDLWVYLEFGVTMFAFIFGAVSLDLNDGSKAFNIVYLVLTIISIVLACIDCFIYFVQMGSCALCLKTCYAKLKKRGEESELELLEYEAENKGCCRMSKARKEKFNAYFELARNIISEAILYPLLICDLFDFIVGGVFRNVNSDDRLNFTLFVVGSLYLVLAVYIMRMFLIIGSLWSLTKLPTMPNSSGSQGSNIRLLKWFSVHILFQILTHALLIVAVALKIRHENPNFGEQDSIFASSFLWINVILGGLIPITGIISFFVTNYYHMREFSISFWIEMMAMLQAPSFTDTVFPSEDGQSPGDLAMDFVKNSELKKVQKQFERYKSPSWYTKFFFPLRLPLLVLIGSLYVLGLFFFLASLALTQNPVSPTGSSVETVLFDDIPLTITFFVCGVLLMAFNVKIVVLILVFFALAAIFLVAASVVIIILLPFVILIYFPLGCCVACLRCCRGTVKEFSIFSQPGTRINYFHPA